MERSVEEQGGRVNAGSGHCAAVIRSLSLSE